MVREPTPAEQLFERITAWVGSVPSLLVHTCAFIGAFIVAGLGWLEWDSVLLIVTTIVSLEAIYLAIFIQMTVNRQAQELHEVSEDVEDIQEDVAEISEDVEEISKDVDEIQEDVEEISEDVEEMSDDWDLEGKDGSANSPEALRKQLAEILAKLEAMNEKP